MNSLSALMLTLSALNGAPQGEVLDFTAKWCGPCQSVAPVVERLHRKGYPIRKIDIDNSPELARKYGVQSIPQFILVIDGKPAKRLIGPQSEQTLLKLMAQIPKPAPEASTEEKEETAVARDDRPNWRRGIPIPFLGKSQEIEAEDIETIRGQNDETDSESTLGNVSTEIAEKRGPLTFDPMKASVRLRVNQGGTINFGTGTVIESRTSRTLVISCGHIFRGIDSKTLIDVDYFDGQDKTTFQGKLLRYDEKADVGLIVVQTDRLLPTIQIATDPAAIRKKDLVSSVGCGNGNPPTRWQMFVNSVDQFVGSSIIECSHAPLSGRSGGGLFNRRGELIGICMAADRERDSGLYAGLTEIHKLLDSVSLTSLYQKPGTEKPALAKSKIIPKEPKVAAAPEEQPENFAWENLSERAPLDPGMEEIIPPKVHQLSGAEIDAVAAALQMSGKSGVTITIESVADEAEGYQVVITNRVEKSPPAETVRTAAAPTLSDQLASRNAAPPEETLNWDNLLERRETNKLQTSSLSSTELPVWAH